MRVKNFIDGASTVLCTITALSLRHTFNWVEFSILVITMFWLANRLIAACKEEKE